MAKFPNFIGPTYLGESLLADAEDCQNWIPEQVVSPGGRNSVVYYRTPGTSVFTTLPHTPLRAIAAGENRLFVVCGSKFCEVLSNGTVNVRGDVGNDGNPCDIVLNGNQVLIASAGLAWIDNGTSVSLALFDDGWTDLAISASNSAIVSSAASPFTSDDVGITIVITAGTGFTAGTYTVVSVDGSGNATLSASAGATSSTGGAAQQAVTAARAAYLDGYFWAQDAFDLASFHLSNLSTQGGGAVSWDPTQFALKTAFPDNISAILMDHEEMWIWGDEQSTEVWRNNGQVQPNFPFQRDPGAIIHHACRAPFSPVRLGQGVAWLAGDQDRGGVYAVYAQGYIPQTISTPALEAIWNAYSKTSDAVSYSEIRNGHQIFVISFPTAGTSFGYDLATGWWHRRGSWNGSSTGISKIAFQCYLGLGALKPTWYGGGGLSSDANLYTIDNSYLNDAGTQIERIRQAPYVADRAFQVVHHQLQVLMQTGFSGASLNPSLTWSDDGGQTWATPLQLSIASGKYLAQACWGNASSGAGGLGVSPRGRIYKLIITDSVDVALIDADIEVSPGRY